VAAYNWVPASRTSPRRKPVTTQDPLQLILDYIASLFAPVGIGWFEGLQILLINLRDAIFG